MIELKDKETKQVIQSAPQGKSLGARCLSFGVGVLGSVLAFASVYALVEGLFALAHVGEDTVARPDPLLGYTHIENHNVTFRSEGYSRSRVNALGFRDKIYRLPKPAGTQRVCVVGDSMTMGLEVALDKTFSKVLEKRLQAEGRNVEVLNCGMTGSGTGQQYLGFRKYIAPLQPDMLIVAYHLGDTDDNVGGGTNPPRPTFELDDQRKLRIDFKDVDKWFAGENSRFYSSFAWFRSHSRILAVLSKADLDLHADPSYKFLMRFVEKPLQSVWSRFLKTLPEGNWHIAQSRSVAEDMLPNSGESAGKTFSAPSSPLKSDLSSTASAPKTPEKQLSKAGADIAAPKEAVISTQNTSLTNPVAMPPQPAAAAVVAPVAVQRGQDDIALLQGMIAIHNNRMAVTSEILRRLNQECRKINCKLVVCGLPAYDNSIIYYRELNDIAKQAKAEGFQYIPSWQDYPARKPMADSPHHFTSHFNNAGHQVLSDSLYRALFCK
ncbi:MAG: hypothetical protein K2X27_13090 [Candidatus Obscuribacterales bacterium]|nr:hypothetical protein [Candidatus Obscuribacterales bacterium]